MLTALAIPEPEKTEPTVLFAPQLLAMLQQAFIGFEKPTGTGVLSDPWIPKKPSQWWYCSKEKPKPTGGSERFTTDATKLAWLKVGGKYVSVKPDSFYASQHEAPKTGEKTAPKTTYDDLAYSDIYATMTLESGPVHDAATAIQLRKLLKGEAGGTPVLPLLTTVLFLSEVARNHTAFHTNLMMLDLVEKGVSITSGTSFNYSFKTVLWNPDIINAVTAVAGFEQQKMFLGNQKQSLQNLIHAYEQRNAYLSRPDFQRYKGRNSEFGHVASEVKRLNKQISTTQQKPKGPGAYNMDELNEPNLPSKGGESAFSGGMASMSHKGSAWGAAHDLEGEGQYKGVKGTATFPKPTNPLTMVRRKEATILIRWLERSLNRGGIKAVALADDRKLETSGLYEGIENSFGRSDKAFTSVLQLMQKRVESFDVML